MSVAKGRYLRKQLAPSFLESVTLPKQLFQLYHWARSLGPLGVFLLKVAGFVSESSMGAKRKVVRGKAAACLRKRQPLSQHEDPDLSPSRRGTLADSPLESRTRKRKER